MRILYVCNEYPPGVHGGIGSFTRDIAEAMFSKGHQVTIWGVYSGLNESICEVINGIQVLREAGLEANGRFGSIRYRWVFQRLLKQYLKKNEFDIVECQEWLGLLPFSLNHKGFVVRLHGAAIFFDKLLERKGNRLAHWFEKQMLANSKNLIAVSDYCGAETLKICGLENKAYKVVYNAVDIEKLQKYQSEEFNLFKIVFANSVLRKKGVFELVESFNLVAEKFPLAELHIIGKLGYSEQGVNIKNLLEEKVSNDYRDRLKIRGWLDSADDVYKELSSAHVCVYPSHMEGFGIAPVEPMALGKPVLFMKNGPGKEVIEDELTGLLIDSFSPSDIADKIIRVFEDNKIVERCKIEGPKRVRNLFDKNGVFAENNLDYYKGILND